MDSSRLRDGEGTRPSTCLAGREDRIPAGRKNWRITLAGTASFDSNNDGKVALSEIPEKRLKNEIDLDTDGFVNEREWAFYRSKRMSQEFADGRPTRRQPAT